MPKPDTYNTAFFQNIRDGSLLSARRVVPSLMDLFRPQSVVDVGCGTGAWLLAFAEAGVSDFLGIDGDYVKREDLLIPPDRFMAADISQPLHVPRHFDLVVSLVQLGEVIVFSAAIPLQGGTHHVNEQWPHYWKKLFADRDFEVVDCLRGRFWNDPDVERWYRQNLLLYVKKSRLESDATLKALSHDTPPHGLDIVHPAVFLSPTLSSLFQMIPRTLVRGIRRRLSKGPVLAPVGRGNGEPARITPQSQKQSLPNPPSPGR
jgi:hypothetical protein